MKKVAATSGHSRSLGFFFALSGAGAAGMNSWLLRAGVLANFDGFLLGLSHQMRCNRSIHRIENLWKKFCKKTRAGVELGRARWCGIHFTAETPRAQREPSCRRARPETLLCECHSKRSRPFCLQIIRRSRRTPALLGTATAAPG